MRFWSADVRWAPPPRILAGAMLVLLAVAAGCTPMSNRPYTQSAPHYRGLIRVAVLLRPWFPYQQLPGQPRPDSDFITGETPFFAALENRQEPEPRAVGVAGLEEEVADLLLTALRRRGYEPVLLPAHDLVPSDLRVAGFLARQRLLIPEMDAYLLGFFGPTLYVSRPEQLPVGAHFRPYSLAEITRHLNPGRGALLWAGPAAAQAPPLSISHAVIHLSLTLFRAADGKPMWQVAGSRVAGHPRGIVVNCPPFPSRESYWTGPEVIRRLMLENLACRLHFLLPDAIPGPGASRSFFSLAGRTLFPHNGDRRICGLSLPGNAPCP